MEVLDISTFIPEEIIFEKELKPKIVTVVVSQPNPAGFFEIDFSDKIRVLKNCTDWDWQNEGADKLKIEYEPSETTKTYMYDMDLEVIMQWEVIAVNSLNDTIQANSTVGNSTTNEQDPAKRRLQEKTITDADNSTGI